MKQLVLLTFVVSVACAAIIKSDQQQGSTENEIDKQKPNKTVEMTIENDLHSDPYSNPTWNQRVELLSVGEERTHPQGNGAAEPVKRVRSKEGSQDGSHPSKRPRITVTTDTTGHHKYVSHHSADSEGHKQPSSSEYFGDDEEERVLHFKANANLGNLRAGTKLHISASEGIGGKVSVHAGRRRIAHAGAKLRFRGENDDDHEMKKRMKQKKKYGHAEDEYDRDEHGGGFDNMGHGRYLRGQHGHVLDRRGHTRAHSEMNYDDDDQERTVIDLKTEEF